jgi:hypothetical protein
MADDNFFLILMRLKVGQKVYNLKTIILLCLREPRTATGTISVLQEPPNNICIPLEQEAPQVVHSQICTLGGEMRDQHKPFILQDLR